MTALAGLFRAPVTRAYSSAGAAAARPKKKGQPQCHNDNKSARERIDFDVRVIVFTPTTAAIADEFFLVRAHVNAWNRALYASFCPNSYHAAETRDCNFKSTLANQKTAKTAEYNNQTGSSENSGTPIGLSPSDTIQPTPQAGAKFAVLNRIRFLRSRQEIDKLIAKFRRKRFRFLSPCTPSPGRERRASWSQTVDG